MEPDTGKKLPRKFVINNVSEKCSNIVFGVNTVFALPIQVFPLDQSRPFLSGARADN